MYFDALTMGCMADELRMAVLDGRVQQVVLPDKLSVGLEIYSHHQRHYLLASAHAQMGRLLLASHKLRRGVDKETGMLLLLRKYARGAILSSIEQPPFERILRLGLDHPEWGYTELIIELMGRHSNLILVDAAYHVLDAVKRVGPQLSSVRPVLPGRPYLPPPPQAKLPPSDLTQYRLREILANEEPDGQVWQALVQGLRGMSPLLAREITFRALGQPRARIAQVERLTPLLEATRQLHLPLSSGEWHPSIIEEDDRAVVYAPYPLTHRGEPRILDTMSHAIEAYAAAMDRVDPYGAAKRSVLEVIATARARLERQRDALERSLNQAAQAEKWRRWGEWILAYAHEIEPGQKEIQADTGEEEVLRIPLDPEKSGSENAQTYFARYRKAQRAAEDVPARLEETLLRLQDLEQLETDLELATVRPEIDHVRHALAQAGYIRTKKARGSKTTPGQPLSLESPDGLTILVGRNSRQNDQVTFRQGKSDDWWFHARGVPGAHVLVRGTAQDLPPDTIRRAAELAAFFSPLRNEGAVLVDYTQRRHVRRIPRAAPGLVTYSQEKTIRVVPQGFT